MFISEQYIQNKYGVYGRENMLKILKPVHTSRTGTKYYTTCQVEEYLREQERKYKIYR